MKWIAMLLVLAGMMIGVTGCGGGDGIAISKEDRAERRRRIRDFDRRSLNDDVDLLWLNDRPARFTEWKVD